ncbi:Peptidyl-prolyl isomerase cwc27 [Bachmanniomyces sp. S44760]|nr:Peptidyl-prolyl isomerase cwc27 [Bachmanniomyces sp. S44760]
MSSLYNLEPQPTAKVLLQTTSGDLLLELFAKQTPLASRNFLQLCLNGYYDNTIFHRLVPGFVVQGGDATGTGEGGESIYDGGPFADEIHSRLKFNRRGLLGMANTGTKDDNGSQFFLTLGKTEELNGRNTMFGRIVGDTIYNLVKIGEAELVTGEGSERPLYPIRITGTEILVNPFEDMVRGFVTARAQRVDETTMEKKKTKKKAGKTLLSFGADEEQNVAAEAPIIKAKFNTKLISAPNSDHTMISINENHKKNRQDPRANEPIRKQPASTSSPTSKAKPDQVLQLPLPDLERSSQTRSASPESVGVGKVSSLLERTNVQIAELKASMKRNISAPDSGTKRKLSALEQMIPENSTRGRKRKHGANGSATSDAQALAIMHAFRQKLKKAPAESAARKSPVQIDEQLPVVLDGNPDEKAHSDDEEATLCDLHFIANCQSCRTWDESANNEGGSDVDDEKGWMSHSLSFERDRLGKDLTWKRKNEEELVVIDPREKAKDIKEDQKSRRKGKGGAETTAWGRDRDRGRVPDKLGAEKI